MSQTHPVPGTLFCNPRDASQYSTEPAFHCQIFGGGPSPELDARGLTQQREHIAQAARVLMAMDEACGVQSPEGLKTWANMGKQ